jgi:hypothetical protein
MLDVLADPGRSVARLRPRAGRLEISSIFNQYLLTPAEARVGPAASTV